MSRRRPAVRPTLAALTLVAAVATAGSLYFSEVLGLTPCDLCWIQRVFMYPLTVVLGVAAYERRAGVWRTGLPLSLAGGGVAAYHSWLQVQPAARCTIDAGCTTIQYPMLGGLLTIPRLALLGFLLVSLGLGTVAAADRA